MGKNLLIMHGGGPTAVINSSLYGVLKQARDVGFKGHQYAAIGGTGGLLSGRIKDLSHISDVQLNGLLSSPSSAIGTSRDHLEDEDYDKIAQLLADNDIGYLLMNGGNGTMDTCGKIYKACGSINIKIIGIPKTMDNDISVTDHSPGFGSAARYIAGSTAELCADVAGMPIHIVVLEALGRNAGWVSAASSLAKFSYDSGPDLIYLPECAFSEDAFLSDVQKIIDSKGHGVVVASEGLHDKHGKPIVPPAFTVERATYFGDVGAHLSNLIIKKLGYKARNEKPGLLGRSSIAWQAQTDREEAILVGRRALKAALDGENGKMVALRRKSESPYQVETYLVDIEQVMLHEKVMPENFINKSHNHVTQDFIDWCLPLVDGQLPKIIDIR